MRVIEDGGATANVIKPLKVPVFEPGRVPDPVTCAGALIVINDRSDGNPRPRLALSNGSSWDVLARVEEIPLGSGPQADLAPMVTQAVLQRLPALVRAHVPALPAPVTIEQKPSDPVIAQALIEMADTIQRQAHVIAELQARVEFIEQNGMAADARIKVA